MNTAQPSTINMRKEYALFSRAYDMGEPARAMMHVWQSPLVSRDGIWVIIEPLADD